ncbi:MAG: 3-dehydroquinate synthase [Nitrospirota bacterium]
MENIKVELGERSYDISIGSNILDGIGEKLKSFGFSPKIAIISNPTVFSLYGKCVADSIKSAGFSLLTVNIPDGEQYKNLTTLQQIYDELLKFRLDRKSALIALGGGVVGDITGFAASTYMRGIAYIQIPTTLLAQVDSSVGGKTGIDHELGKNMIGTFWQPRLVWIDIETLKTLPQRELLAGLAEVIKYGVIWDKGLFDFLGINRDKILNLDKDALTHIIKRSCEIKAEIVSRDERESGLRAILNYGHTIGHAIETVTEYKKFLHGEAVAIGMYLEARLSHIIGMIDNDAVSRIKDIIYSYSLPSEMPADIHIDQILSSMQLDKKAVAGELRFILPEEIGNVRIYKGITENILRELLQ